MSQINPFNAHTDISPLVQKLGRHADANRDGHVSAPEFAEFLDNVLHPERAAAPGGAMTSNYRDRMVGFDQPSNASTPSVKARIAALAQHLSPSPEHLRQLANGLGPNTGLLSADGLTLRLTGGEGMLSVRERADGNVWQWLSGDVR
jgi:hypothetical protein